MKGTPLQPNPGSEDGRIRTRMEPGVAVSDVIGDPVTTQEVRATLGEQRPFYLLRANVREAAKVIGYTEGCRGCKAVKCNFTSKPAHTAECRQRMEEQIQKTTRGSQRMAEFEGRLATEVEQRVLNENKLAKTGSVQEGENAQDDILNCFLMPQIRM